MLAPGTMPLLSRGHASMSYAEYYDPRHERFYYYNKVTHECSWTPPPGFDVQLARANLAAARDACLVARGGPRAGQASSRGLTVGQLRPVRRAEAVYPPLNATLSHKTIETVRSSELFPSPIRSSDGDGVGDGVGDAVGDAGGQPGHEGAADRQDRDDLRLPPLGIPVSFQEVGHLLCRHRVEICVEEEEEAVAARVAGPADAPPGQAAVAQLVGFTTRRGLLLDFDVSTVRHLVQFDHPSAAAAGEEEEEEEENASATAQWVDLRQATFQVLQTELIAGAATILGRHVLIQVGPSPDTDNDENVAAGRGGNGSRWVRGEIREHQQDPPDPPPRWRRWWQWLDWR